MIELIIAIVVISIAATGVLLVYATAVRYSADPMVQQQALAVAEAYLDEILARPASDPRRARPIPPIAWRPAPSASRSTRSS